MNFFIKKINKFSNQSGFSLTESIVYIALFLSLSVLLMNCLLVMYKSFKETRVNNDLLDASQTSIEFITKEIRRATGVNIGSSTFGTSPGVLVLHTTNSSGSAVDEKFYWDTNSSNPTYNSITYTQIGSSTSTSALTGSHVVPTSLVFRNISTSQGGAIKVEMTLQSLRSPSGRTVSISDTVALRGSY